MREFDLFEEAGVDAFPPTHPQNPVNPEEEPPTHPQNSVNPEGKPPTHPQNPVNPEEKPPTHPQNPVNPEEEPPTHPQNSVNPSGEAASVISNAEASALTANPMFAHFARGRQGTFEEILASFRQMLADSSSTVQAEVMAKITPAASQTTLDVPLTERQRAIARAAGMTYREYYTLLHTK